MFKTTEIAKDVYIHTRSTDQFKTINFSIKFRRPLQVEEAAERTVLTNVLQHSNAKYPSPASMRMHLDDLYGTVLYLDTTKKGNEHTVLLNVETVNDHYLQHGDVLDHVLELMNTVLFDPNFVNGEFKENIVAREKEMVRERIQSIFDEKSRYAQNRLNHFLAPDHPASISANGTIPAVEAITPQSLTNTYQRMIAEDVIDIYVVGDIDEEKMIADLKTALPFQDRKAPFQQNELPKIQPTESYVHEKQEMKQGKLHIGFTVPVFFTDADFPKMQIFNGIFGGYPHSKLFMNVREKESMAYYCSSSYSAQYGLVYVMSGIDTENVKKATQLIDEQLEAMSRGEITDLELSQTKAMLQNQLKEALDSARGQIEIYDQYKELDPVFKVEHWQEKWKAVTKEDIVDMAKQLHKETVYFLSGMEEKKIMEPIYFEQLDETLYYEKLENGLDVYILPKKGFSKTFVTFTTKYGSVDRSFVPLGEKEAVTVPDGIAHFLEHKMFEKEDGDVFQKFSQYGASANAFTSFTRTAYLFSATNNVKESTETLLDFVQEPYFTEKTVNKEKGIIGQEITMYDDQPDWRLYFGTIENMFKEHPVKIDIAGTVESIDKITAEHLYTCYHTFYHPSNMLLFAIGALEPEEMLDLIKSNQAKKTFEKPEDIKRIEVSEPKEVAIPERTLHMDVSKSKVSVGLKAKETDLSGREMLKNELAISLALDVLFGRSSDFYTKVYDEGLIDESYSYDFSLEHGFGFAMISSDTHKPDKLVGAIKDQLQKAEEKWPFGEEELERVKRRRIGFNLRALNSIEYIANQFTRYKFNEMNLFDSVEVIEELNVADVQKAFQSLQGESQQTVFTILPLSKEKEESK